MPVWGISATIQVEPLVRAIEVTGPRDAPTFRQIFQHRSDPNDNWAQQLRALDAALETQLRQGTPSAAVVRAMDWWSRRGENVYRQRYGLDAMLLSVLARHMPRAEALSGREI